MRTNVTGKLVSLFHFLSKLIEIYCHFIRSIYLRSIKQTKLEKILF